MVDLPCLATHHLLPQDVPNIVTLLCSQQLSHLLPIIHLQVHHLKLLIDIRSLAVHRVQHFFIDLKCFDLVIISHQYYLLLVILDVFVHAIRHLYELIDVFESDELMLNVDLVVECLYDEDGVVVEFVGGYFIEGYLLIGHELYGKLSNPMVVCFGLIEDDHEDINYFDVNYC